jgi:hypothetical protein
MSRLHVHVCTQQIEELFASTELEATLATDSFRVGQRTGELKSKQYYLAVHGGVYMIRVILVQVSTCIPLGVDPIVHWPRIIGKRVALDANITAQPCVTLAHQVQAASSKQEPPKLDALM